MYAQSKNIPSFWNDVYKIHNQTPNPHKMIIGDFNCTLDPQADTMGYKSDPHKKSREVINNWLTNETLIDTFTCYLLLVTTRTWTRVCTAELPNWYTSREDVNRDFTLLKEDYGYLHTNNTSLKNENVKFNRIYRKVM